MSGTGAGGMLPAFEALASQGPAAVNTKTHFRGVLRAGKLEGVARSRNEAQGLENLGVLQKGMLSSGMVRLAVGNFLSDEASSIYTLAPAQKKP